MYKTILVLPDGTEISSGVGVVPNVRRCKIIDLANDGEDLNPGSVCCACAEVTIFSPGGSPGITAGSQFALYKEDDAGVRHKIGVFNAEKPTRTSANVYKVTAYDNVSKLDVDLTEWLTTLAWINYPDEIDKEDPDKGVYDMQAFAEMIFKKCGLTWAGGDMPNGTFTVVNLPGTEATGRQLMQWICEIAGRRCRATVGGEIELVPYTDKTADVIIGPTGSSYYLGGSLQYADYEVAAIDGVRYRVGTGVHTSKNPYPIKSSNVIWANYIGSGIAYVDDEDENLIAQLAIVGAYTPCKIAIPAWADIQAGDIISVVTPEGKRLRVPVMELVWDGQCMTLEATGSASRTGSSSIYS